MMGIRIHRTYARTAYGALRGRNRYAADLPLGRQLALLRRGLLPVSGLIYDQHDLDSYLSDSERFTRGGSVNGDKAALLNDKLAFHHMVSAHDPTLVPVALAVIHRGAVLPADADGPTALDELRTGMVSLGRTVVKPNHDGGGNDVYLITHEDGTWSVNGTATDWDGVVAVLLRIKAALVSAFVQQAPYAQAIYPGSTNTLRMLTLRGRDGEVFLARAVHRFGSDRTAPVDNWAQGGFSCLVDLDTGALGPGVTHPSASSRRSYDEHPDTSAAFTGTPVSSWHEVSDRVLALARRVPLDYVGWDVVVTEQGPVLLEGNSNTGVGLLQVHGPLLADPRVRQFYTDKGIVRR